MLALVAGIAVIAGMGRSTPSRAGALSRTRSSPAAISTSRRRWSSCSPGLIFLLSWMVELWPVALAWAIAFALWRCFAWGYLIGLGRFRPSDSTDTA
jgi:hypothetical protein